MRTLLVVASFIIFVLGSLCGSTFAQTATGEITGTITDSQGRGVQGVAVFVHNLLAQTTVRTDQSGYYAVRLQPGTYDVKVDHLGFAVVQHNGIRVEAGQRVRIDFELEPSQATVTAPVWQYPKPPLSDSLGGAVFVFVLPTLILSGFACLILYAVFRRLTFNMVATAVGGSAVLTSLLVGLYLWFLSTHRNPL